MMNTDSLTTGTISPNGAEPMSLEELLRSSGPYALDASPPSDEELFARIDLFGVEVWRVGRATEREAARQMWVEYLDRQCIPVMRDAWRIVQVAIDGGRSAASGSRWSWYTAADLAALPPPEELVRDVLPVGAFAMLYGPRGIGKTFLALDLACTIDSGSAWHGHVVRKGRVAYVLAEGRGGLARRIEAWQSEHGGESGVRFLTHAVRLLDDGDVGRLIESLSEADEPLALLFLDTLARCVAPGDENSTRDMGIAVAQVDRIREATGATVVAVHHTGHDETRERGSSALGCAVDTLLAVSRDADVITLACKKQRDGPEFPPLRFRLQTVEESVVPQLVVGDEGITGVDRQALEALEAACVAGEWVPTSVWHQSSGLLHRTFHRCRKKLVEMALVEVEERGRYRYNRPALTENERD